MAASDKGFSAEERAAMKERAAELKASSRRGSAAEKAAADLADLRAKVEEMTGTDRAIAEALHSIVTEHAPQLAARTWYGMPAYARDGKAVVFFKAAGKFKTRYAEVGFNEQAQLDDGAMWPTAYAVTEATPEVQAALVELVRRAAG